MQQEGTEQQLSRKWLDDKVSLMMRNIIDDPGSNMEEISLRVQAYGEVMFILGYGVTAMDNEDEIWSHIKTDELSLDHQEIVVYPDDVDDNFGEVCVYCLESGHDSLECNKYDDVDDFFTETTQPTETLTLDEGDTPVAQTDKNGVVWGYEEMYDGEPIIVPVDDDEPCYKRNGTKITCSCRPMANIECLKCNVGRLFNSSAWRPWRLDADYDILDRVIGTTPPAKTPAQKSLVVSTTATTKIWSGYTTGKDRHYGEPYTVFDGSFEVYPSSLNNVRNPEDATKTYFVPDFGLYADTSWKPIWRNEFIAWPDYGVPTDLQMAVTQISDVIERIRKGQKVEVGCIGGHGRTGTILAVMNVLIGAKPDEAIEHVKTKYCHHAIESEVQEWYVDWVYAVINGKPVPEKPVVKPKVYTSSVGSPSQAGTACSKAYHLLLYVDGKECKPSCLYWRQDLVDFKAGRGGVESWVGDKLINHSNAVQVRDWLVPRRPTNASLKLYPIHNPAKIDTCECDVCRYLRSGFQAFLCPVNYKEKAEHEKEMDHLGRLELARIIARLPKDVPPTKNELIKISQPDGSIIEVSAHSDFIKKNPIPNVENPSEGQTSGLYTYNNGNWIWTPAKAISNA